ncbi:putative CCR4-NOT transcription complex subunit 4 [Helianthus debilis subsp. tardiflorus]
MKRFEVYSQYMGFVLEGRPLKACFGTTKYCHAWLRSMPCTNPDCLYLHEFGSQEDSFTKDEIIYDYTRTGFHSERLRNDMCDVRNPYTCVDRTQDHTI